MACKIRNLTDSAVQSAITNVVVKTAGKYKPEGTTLSIDTKDFSLEELTSIVEKWSIDTYKTAAFTNNWFTVNETPDKVVINFTAPNKLVKAYEVKLGIKSLDQVNNELMGLDEDVSLAQQPSTTIKPGVAELFESNPELANSVYEAAGFESDKKALINELYPVDFIKPNERGIGRIVVNKKNGGSLSKRFKTYDVSIRNGKMNGIYHLGGTMFSPIDSDTPQSKMLIKDRKEALVQDKYYSILQILSTALANNITDFSENITGKGIKDLVNSNEFKHYKNIDAIRKELYENLKEFFGTRVEPSFISIKEVKNTDYSLKLWLSEKLNISIDKIDIPNDILIEFKIDDYLNYLLDSIKTPIIDAQITPQQKQQAQQLYSQYVKQTGKQDIEGFKEFVQQPSTTIKPGVEELFESNESLANAVYEAVGFNVRNIDNAIAQLDNPINKNINKILSINVPSEVYPEEVQEQLHGLDVGDTFVIQYEDGKFNIYVISPDIKVKIGTYINKDGVLDFGAYDFKKFLGKSLIAEDISKNDIRTILRSSEAEEDFKEYEYQKEAIEEEYQITLQQKQQAQQLYSQYLDTIFPDSKVKDIVYHGTNEKFDKFDKSKLGSKTVSETNKLGFFFAQTKKIAELFNSMTGQKFRLDYISVYNSEEKIEKLYNNYVKRYGEKEARRIITELDMYGNENTLDGKYDEKAFFNRVKLPDSIEIPVVLNLKNPSYEKGDEFLGFTMGKHKEGLEYYKNKTKNNDGIVFDKVSEDRLGDDELTDNNYVVFEPEQIHILGSKQDIEGFKEFVQQPSTRSFYQEDIPQPYPEDLFFDPPLEQVNYVLKSIDLLDSDRGKQIFAKGKKANWSLDKILSELQIPREQKQLILDLGSTNREDIITDLLANYSYTVEINTAKNNVPKLTADLPFGEENFEERNTNYYAKLSVPGGTKEHKPFISGDWKYEELRLTIPNLEHIIKGHGQFEQAEDWGHFRVSYNDKTKQVIVHEIQNDEAQKLVNNFTFNAYQYNIQKQSDGTKKFFKANYNKEISAKEYYADYDKYLDTLGFKGLLLKNWELFMIKALIQDSAKKGYYTVLFPKGDEAQKAQGHTTLEEFKKQKEDRIKELEAYEKIIEDNKDLYKKSGNSFTVGMSTKVPLKLNTLDGNTFEEAKKNLINKTNIEINQLKQELERVEKEGFGALSPIYNFYENTVTNILKKQGYTPVLITDEYGNTWNEVVINTKRDSARISFFRPDVRLTPTNTLDQEVSIKLPSYDEQVEEFFQNAEDSYNPGATYSQEQSSFNFGNEAITTLMQVLSDNLGVPFEIVESSEEAAKILRDSGLEYNNEPAFFFNGKVYFVQNRINAEIVFHEFAHPLIQSIRISNPKLFNQLYDQLLSTPEGQAILERVQRLYNYTGDRLKEEVIVTAIGLEAEMSGTGKTVSKPYKTWLDKIMFHIKQFLRKLFGNKITVEKLSPNTTLKQLVDMMTGEKFALNSEVFTTNEVAEFIKLEVEDQKLFVQTVENSGQEVINLIASAQVAAQEFEQLIKRSNDAELRKIIDNDPVLKNIKSTVSQARQSVTAIVGDAIAKNQQASSVIYALMGYEQILNTINANVNQMRSLKAGDVTPESIARILYYNDLAQYIDTEFISVLEEALNVPGTGLTTVATTRQALQEVINALRSSRSLIDNIKNLHNKILEGQLTGFLTVLTKDMNLNINAKFGKRFKDIAEKGGASEALAEIIKEKLLANQDLTPQEKSAISKAAENALKTAIKEYKGVEITPEKIRAELVGEASNMNWLNAYLEGYSASQSLISGPFFAYLKNKYAEIDAQAASISADMINELQPYLKNLSKNEILLLGKAIAFEDTVADLDDKGELIMRKVWSYLNQFQNYRYDLSQLEYNLAKANESKDQDAIRKAYAELRQFKRDYMWQKYDKSFYDVEYEVYDKNDVTRDALREKEILLNELKIERTPLQTEQDRFNSYSKIRALERQLKELSKLTYEDGTDKIDDPSRNIYDKTKALTHREYNERIKKFYEYNLIEGEFERALQSFESSLIAEGLTQEEIDKRINEWLDQNTRVEFSEQYFVDKQNAISALEYFISTKFPAGTRNQRIVDIHRQISDLLILARDPSGQIDISVLSKETRTLIKDLQEEIIEIQKDQVNASGLSSNEWVRYNYLSKKPSMLTPTESNEYAFLRDKMNSMGLNKTDKETYYRLLGDISELTSKKPTQDYIDTVNYWLSGKLGLAELNEEEAEKLTEKNTADYYMSLDGDFRDWFLDNHVVRENKDGKYYERVYIWNRIQPDERYLKKTTFELSDGSKRTIDAVPGSRFYKRSVKKEFMTLKTDDWSKYVGVYIDNTNLSDNPNFLPRPYKPGDPNSAKDDRYINKDFQNLDKNSDIAKILEIIKKYHLKTQSFVSTYGKLYLDLPRFGIEDNLELILRGEIKKKALRTWTQVKGLISKEAREEAPLFPETGGDVNYDTQRNLIRVNSLGEEQEYIPIGGLSRLETDQVSLDVIRTTHKYLFSALRYKQLSEMDPLGRALRDFTSSEENALKDTKKVNRNIFLTKRITKFAKSRRQDLRALQISHLYDREFLGVQNNDFGNNPYLNKITKFFMKQVSFGFFALDLVSATKNWGGQIVQNLIESAGGKNVSLYSLAIGSKMAHQQMVRMQGQRYEKENLSLETQLLLNFDPGQSYFSQNFGKTQSRSFISDVTSLSFFMSPRKFLERQSVLELFFGMMHHKVITRTTSEGLVNIRYIDAWELDSAGKIKLKDGVDKKYDIGGTEYAKFKTLAQASANKLYGAYSDIDLPMANKYYAYKVTTFLRRYFTEMFMNRFGFSTREGNVGGYRYNWAMSNVERGYYVEGVLALLRMFNVSNKYWQFMSKDEKYALRKITMELAILVALYMMSTILFGYDPDDEDRYKRLREKSGDMFSDNFNIDWWLAQHTILFSKNVFAETSSFIPLPKLGLEDLRENADLTSLVFGRSIGQMGTLGKDLFYMSIGSEKAKYTRDVGPFTWQEKESYKIYNHLFSMLGVKGKFYDPVGRGIMPQESVEARK